MKRLHMTVMAIIAPVIALAVTVGVDVGCDDMGKIVWSERVQTNGTTKLVLQAEAATGCAFSGWTVEDSSGQEWTADLRYAGSLTATVSTNAVVTASFIAESEDCLSFALEDALPDEVERGESVFCPLEIESVSFPTLKFSGLPPGLAYDSHTLTLAGKPSEPGVYQIEATGVNASGFSFRSYAEMRVGNIEGTRISGSDTEISLDGYFHARIDELFTCMDEVVSAKLTGVPPGLTWDEEWQLLYGTPTEPGDYTIKATVEFSEGGSETATLVLSVVAPDPSDYDVDLEILSEVQVGDVFEAEETEIGTDANGEGIVDVKGLPTGLYCEKWRTGNIRHWGLSGQLTKPGRFRVWVSVTDDSGVTQRVVRTSRVVTVNDVPQQYLSAFSSDDARGSVLGGGAVTPGLPVELVAKPVAGQVFAGWYDDLGECHVLGDGTDYRTPHLTLPGDTDYLLSNFLAQFVSSDEDEAPEFADLEDETLVLSDDLVLEHVFSVYSASLPELTFKGLPKGFVCTARGAGDYLLSYDAATSAGGPTPGRYSVTATAVNVSKRKTSAGFLITVLNRVDPRLHVEDDYGEFTPGEAIEPIDLSDAVDFVRGETLAVSGLPKGLSYNTKANEEKGIEAHTITGTPTVPGDYTLTFTGKVVSSVTTNARGTVSVKYETATATSFMTVLPYPELAIEMDEEAIDAGCKVTGSGNYKPGTKVTLQAKAAKDWVFAGWDGLDEIDVPQSLNPKLSYVSGEEDVLAYANFITVDSDYISLSEPVLSEGGFAVELPLKRAVDEKTASLIVTMIDTASWPTVKVTGLPTGLKFSASTLLLSGAPTKSGVYHVTVTAKNAGGYSYVRVIDVAVLNADGSVPEEASLPNAAEIDFAPWANLMTGVSYGAGDCVLTVPPSPMTGAAVKKVSVSGQPTGLKPTTCLQENGSAEIELIGVPTKPGRFVVSVSVSYVTGKAAKSQCALVVEDGGSSYLYVQPGTAGGSVTGAGVYAAGQTVKLTAKAAKGYAFAGWTLSDATPLDVGDVDYRTQSVSFQLGAADYLDDNVIFGNFVTAAEDQSIAMTFPESVWPIDPDEPSSISYSLTSASLPKVAVKGLPKGVALDAVAGVLRYSPTAAVVPGVYAVEFSVKNVSVAKAKTFSLEVQVANFESEVIGGLDPAMDAYQVPVGVQFDIDTIVPQVAEGWALSVKGLPSGLSFKDGAVVGIPSKSGNYTVTFTATTGSGRSKRTETATIVIRVFALPMALTGTFNGFLYDESGNTVGTIAVSATAAGKISASVKLPDKTRSFSAKAWDSYGGQTAELEVVGKDSTALSLTTSALSEWPEWPLSGGLLVNGTAYAISGQRFPYGKKDGSVVAKEEIKSLVGTSSAEGWTAKIAQAGTVTLTGTHGGKRISGTSSLFCDEEGYFAEIVCFSNKNTALSILSRFDDKGIINGIELKSVILP